MYRSCQEAKKRNPLKLNWRKIMNRREAQAAFTTILDMARQPEKHRLKTFLEAFIAGEVLQLQSDDKSWVDFENPSFKSETLRRMRVKPGPTPFGSAAIHKLNGKLIRHRISGEVRTAFVDLKHQVTTYKKDKTVTAKELLKDWEGMDGELLGNPHSDKKPEIKSSVSATATPMPVVPPKFVTNVGGIKNPTPAVPYTPVSSVGFLGSHQLPLGQRLSLIHI
jgi:hypothetical protein